MLFVLFTLEIQDFATISSLRTLSKGLSLIMTGFCSMMEEILAILTQNSQPSPHPSQDWFSLQHWLLLNVHALQNSLSWGK